MIRLSTSQESTGKVKGLTRKQAIVTLIIFTAINFVNYVDRFTIAGVLNEIECFYDISHTEGGLLQTVFILALLIFSPLFGYLGDRFNRKYLLMVGVVAWSLFVLLGSFIPADCFPLFMTCRALVGIGEATYVTISPVIIGDIFPENERMLMLSIYSLAIPTGSGFGFVIGAGINGLASEHMEDDSSAWQWSQRVTPVFGLILVILTGLFVKEPPRGANEKGNALNISLDAKSPFKEDLKYVVTNKSVLCATLGFTSVSYIVGALAFWMPDYLAKVNDWKNHKHTNEDDSCGETDQDNMDLAVYFGMVTCVASILGVALGSSVAKRLKAHFLNSEALVCAWGSLLSAPFILLGLVIVSKSFPLTFFFILVAEIFFISNVALIPKILIETVVPNKRSLASGFSQLIGHLFGDAFSPLLVGIIADKTSGDNSYLPWGLQNGLLTAPLVAILGSAAFFVCSFYFESDQEACEDEVKRLNQVSNHVRTTKTFETSPEQAVEKEELNPLLNSETNPKEEIC